MKVTSKRVYGMSMVQNMKEVSDNIRELVKNILDLDVISFLQLPGGIVNFSFQIETNLCLFVLRIFRYKDPAFA